MDERTLPEASPKGIVAASSSPNQASFDPRDLIPTPLFCASPEGRLAWMNAAAEQLTGRHAASVAGEPFSVLFPLETRMHAARHFLRQRRRGVTDYYYEAPILAAGDEVHWVGLHVRLASATNGRTAYVCAVHDLQAIHADLEALRRRNQELAARLAESDAGAELKSSFLAAMSSELRAPMNGVIGMSRLLLDSNLDRDQRTWSEVIQSSGQQLLDLVDDILDYSRIESGQLSIGSMDFDLRVTVDAIAALLTGRSHDAGVRFSSLVHHRVPSLLNGDPGRLRHVLLGLAACALDRAEGGEIQLRVELVEETAHQAVVRFWVNRIGGPLGGSPESESDLLGVFSGEDREPHRLGGRGLSLAIGRRLVALMGGDAGAASVSDLGSKLWFRVPLGKQVERPVPVPAVAGASGVDVTRIRALVIDGDAAGRESLAGAIASWGGSADRSENGIEALERLRQAAAAGSPHDVALVDLELAEPGAEQFARAVREDAALSALPLVLVTALGRPGDAARAEEWGYNAYFVKPVEAEELRPALASLLAPGAGVGGRLVTRHTVAEMKRSGIRVLVVEENAIDRLVIASALRRVGYAPEMVGDVAEAAAALTRQPADVVFVDVTGAGEAAYERAESLRAACDGAAHGGARIPLVALVGRVRDEEKERCRAAGVDDLLGKPLDLEGLVTTVHRWVERSAEAVAAVADEVAAELVAPVPTPEPEAAAEAEPSTDAAPEPMAEEISVEAEATAPVAEAQPDPLAALPVLDEATLEAASLGNAEIRGLIVEAFLGRVRQPLDRMKKAAEWNDAGAVQLQAQVIAGMCRAVGAGRCAAMLDQVVADVAGERLDDAGASVGRFEEELAAVRRAWSPGPAAGADDALAQAA